MQGLGPESHAALCRLASVTDAEDTVYTVWDARVLRLDGHGEAALGFGDRKLLGWQPLAVLGSRTTSFPA